ncbi:hypothetical protein [Rhizobium sp. RCC_161_2]|uniref:hypothetical protein n=1 Tax=Rhizobium sp. RCC_161_2 TaxID=3239219 RepID=UPI0035268209
MRRRAFIQGLAVTAFTSRAIAQDNSFPTPSIRTDQKTSWSVLDFQGSSFRAKLENAVREAVGTGINIQLPGGAPHDIDAPIEVTTNDVVRIAISGEGMASTAIRCDGVGISLNGGAGSQYSFKGISFLPQRENQGTALKLEWAKATIGKGFAIEDVGFGSNSPDDKNFFSRGLEIRNKGTGQIIGCWFNGLSTADPQGEGLVLAAANDVTMTNTYMYNLAYACRSDGAGSLEGFRLHGGTFVRVGHGVYFQAAPVGIPYIEVALSHINACYEAIHIEGYSQVNIVDNLLYARKDIKANTDQNDIFVQNCPALTIARNKFFSGMDKSTINKTAIKTVGSVRNGNIAENLASERTVFLDVTDNGVNGAEDIVISKNRSERDLKGRATVLAMYRFTNSPLHKRITWEGYDDDISTKGFITDAYQLAVSKWQIMPFIPDPKATALGIDFKVADQVGEFVTPPGVTECKINCRIHMKSAHQTACEARITLDSGNGFEEVAVGSTFGDDISVNAETDVLRVTIGSRIRIEVKVEAGAVIDIAPEVTRIIITPT